MIDLEDAIQELNHNIEFQGNKMLTEGETVIYLKSLQDYFKITDGIPISELEKLCESYKDGRAPILPCKVGDTVYVIPSGVNYKLNKVTGLSANNRVYAQTIESINFYKDGTYLLITCGGVCSCHSKFYNVNWFITRAEAEAVLKEREGE